MTEVHFVVDMLTVSLRLKREIKFTFLNTQIQVYSMYCRFDRIIFSKKYDGF